MPRTVAILLASYNGERWLAEQIQSILGQTHSKWHLFVRDDASSDRSREIVAEYGRMDARITLIEGDGRRSGSAAANFMAALGKLDVSAFDHVAFCDQDDIWAPARLERALSQMNEREAEAYSCDLIAFDNQTRSTFYVGKSAVQQPLDYLFQGASAGCTYVLSRQAARLVASQLSQHPTGMAVEMSHDWLIYAICRSHGLRWLHDETAHVFYRQHGGNVYGANQRWQGLKKRLVMARSGWYRRQIIWNSHFVRGTEEERAVISAMGRFSWADRWWLSMRVRQFRRDRSQAWLLAVLILLGWL